MPAYISFLKHVCEKIVNSTAVVMPITDDGEGGGKNGLCDLFCTSYCLMILVGDFWVVLIRTIHPGACDSFHSKHMRLLGLN